MITILFYMTVKAGREQECAALAKDVTATTKAQDQGCINYAFYRTRSTAELTTRESWFSDPARRRGVERDVLRHRSDALDRGRVGERDDAVARRSTRGWDAIQHPERFF